MEVKNEVEDPSSNHNRQCFGLNNPEGDWAVVRGSFLAESHEEEDCIEDALAELTEQMSEGEMDTEENEKTAEPESEENEKAEESQEKE